MARPKKGELKVNGDYKKDWYDYEDDRMYIKDRHGNNTQERDYTPILMPILIGITPEGEFKPTLLKVSRVKALSRKLKTTLPSYMFNRKLTKYDPAAIFKDYIDYFDGPESKQGARPDSPLDLKVRKPVWTLFDLKPDSWTFSEGLQFSTENDPDTMHRNFVKIATMDDSNVLLVSNRRRCAPDDLKFNLHVTITQEGDDCGLLKTPIIIDPGQDNNQAGGGWGGWAN